MASQNKRTFTQRMASPFKKIPAKAWVAILGVIDIAAIMVLFQMCDNGGGGRVDESRFNPKEDTTQLDEFFLPSYTPAPEPTFTETPVEQPLEVDPIPEEEMETPPEMEQVTTETPVEAVPQQQPQEEPMWEGGDEEVF